DPTGVSLSAAAGRRPRPARGHPRQAHARGRRLGVSSGRGMTAKRGGGGRELKVRVRTGKGRAVASKRRPARPPQHPYCARAKREGLRSRAAFKLAEIDDRFHLFKPGGKVVDLGAAPGGWSQVAAERTLAAQGRGKVVAIDLLEMEPLPGVAMLNLDFL